MHATLSPDQLIDDPHWLCFGFNPAQRRLYFLHASDGEMERAVFLDQGAFDVSRCVGIELEDVAAALADRPRALPGVILHPAFACSTLLARCLEQPGRSRVLRELPVFSGLAQARLQVDACTWRLLLDCVATLTARPFPGHGLCFNKPSNVFLPAALDFLEAAPAGQAVLIDLGLPEFLLSCAKKAAAGPRPLLAMYLALDPTGAHAARHGVHLPTAPVLSLAGLVWHWQMQLLHRIARSGHSSRVRRLGVDAFLDAPVAASEAALAWLAQAPGIGIDPARIATLMQGDAKRPGQRLDAGLRKTQAEEALARHRQEIDAALEWCERTFGPWQRAYQTGIAPLSFPAA
ncbi:hypothetical protein [Luteimonas vadosa]|uniref:Uncharacterized protein n=1 Tax=Luteimonas vadosa TaxID=1165507 RepID=A0ABP9DYG9_9GAMM